MRRARIKAVATVPVRRKVQQEATATEPTKPKQTSESEPVKPTAAENNVKSEVETTPAAPAEQKKEDQVEHKPGISEKAAESKFHELNSDSEEKNCKKIASPARAATPVATESPKKSETPTKSEKSPVPAAEGSPVKSLQGRSCFTRPTPRLDGGGGRIRRNSMQGSGASASESEDDSRRSTSTASKRIRNDSTCSVQSSKDGCNSISTTAAKLNLGQKRKMVVSESARKLAEARREFHLKHENKTPDKSKLTMYDLIYYNPTTNPMKPKPVNQKPAARKLSVCSTIEKEKGEDETADEPSEMPVPQLKVGPNGELIIDEKSLVIDQYKVQENIDRSEVIVDDDNTGNGFYKRRQKSKDWNKWETVKFYKALNTYGTDFLLMQSVFPNRTRQELKLKYKKEERINSNLVEKALQYQEFDTEALEKDLASVEENERKESEEAKNKLRKDNSSVKKKRKRCKVVRDELTVDAQGAVAERKSGDDDHSSEENARITITKKLRKRKRKKTKLGETPSGKSGDENNGENHKDATTTASDEDDSDSSPEMYRVKPTRSGRAPKRTYAGARKPGKASAVKEGKKPKVKPTKQNKKNLSDEKNSSRELIDAKINEESRPNHLNDTENIGESNKNVDIQVFDEEDDVVDKNGEKIVDAVVVESQQEKIDSPTRLEKSVNSSFRLEEITDDIASMSNLKPGSLVVLKKDSKDEPGKTSLQVYVVSDDYDASNPNCRDSLLPIDMSPEELLTVTSCIKNIEPHKIS